MTWKRNSRMMLGLALLALVFSPAAVADNPNALVWSTFLGGSGDEFGYDIAVDAGGNVIVVGDTNSPDYPTTAGAYDSTSNGGSDMAITKISADGTGLVFSTLLGGSANDGGGSVTLDTSGAIYAVGWSDSTDFPTVLGTSTNAGGEDMVVVTLDSGGNLLYSGYLGGSGNDNSYEEGNIKLDTNGDIIVGGQTRSSDYPVVNAVQPVWGGGAEWDACVTKISGTTGAILFSTYLGGGSRDQSFAIATDSANQIYIAGQTRSTDFPTAGAAYQTTFQGGTLDVFVTVLDSSGSMVYSTYAGGPGADRAWTMCVPSPMVIYVAGIAEAGFPTTAGAYTTTFGGGLGDIFVAKLTASGLAASTFLGGSGREIALSMTADTSGNLWITGETSSTDFPTTPAAYRQAYGGGLNDLYVSELDGALSSLLYSTYLGGSGDDNSGHLAVDSMGTGVYVQGGLVYSADFPVTPGAFDTTLGGNAGVSDMTVTKLDPFAPASPTGSVMINGGAAYTNSTSVTLTLSASSDSSAVAAMQFMNDGETWSGWEPYAASRAWTLTTGDGPKTVFAQYRDANGNVTGGAIAAHTTLDTTPPAGTVVINGGADYTSSAAVILTLSASDSGSGVTQMRFSTEGYYPSFTSWFIPYSASYNLDLASYGFWGNDGVYHIYIQFADAAGNWSSTSSDTIILSRVTPTIPSSPGAELARGQTYSTVTQWGGAGTGNGQFNFCDALALDSAGNVYVVDANNSRIQKFSSNGAYVTQWGTAGSGDGQLMNPRAVAVDTTGAVYVVDLSNSRIQKFTSDGVYLAQWGSAGAGDGQFSGPHGIAVDSAGNVYVTDTDNARIQVFTSNGDFVTKWGSFGAGIGQLSHPWGIAVDAAGHVYVAEQKNHRIQVFTSTGTPITMWGHLGTGAGELDNPRGLALDSAGDLYVADGGGNHRIQKFNANGIYLTQFGASSLTNPHGVAVDALGCVYVADASANSIQKFAPMMVSYDPSTGALPQSAGWAFTDENNPASTVTLAGGTLTLDAPLTDRAHWALYYSHGAGAPTDSGVHMQNTAWIHSETHTAATRGVNLVEVAEDTGTLVASVALYGWENELLLVDGSTILATCAMNTTDGFHEYLLNLKGGQCSVYVDGVLRMSATTSRTPSSGPEALLAVFGDGSAASGSVVETRGVVTGTGTITPGATAPPAYHLGTETALLDDAFYLGEAVDGSNVAGRQTFFGRPSNDGKTVAFWAINSATYHSAIFLVDVGNPSSWRRLTADITSIPSAPIYWTPDDHFLLASRWRIPIATGALEVHTISGYGLNDSSVTRLPSNNWVASLAGPSGTGEVVLLPILPDGNEDASRSPVIVTNLQASAGLHPDWPHISGDGTQLAFADYDTTGPSTADHGDVWVLSNVSAIAGAPKIPGSDISSLAPSSANDPNLRAIRTSESPNFAHTPFFSEDGQLVFYTEDWNNVFQNGSFFATLAAADFDVMISNADGSGTATRLPASGNQFGPIPFAGGTRLLFLRDVGYANLHMFVTTLEVATPVSGTPAAAGSPLPGGGGSAGNDGVNDVVTAAEQQVGDASGTVVAVPTGTVIDFPADAPQEISVVTPIDPVTTPQLPAGVGGIPVVREFGPTGTQFWPAITITFTYTDQEIAGLDEATLRVFLFNPATNVFDLEVPESDIVERDLANNRILFRVSHFSTYGLGGTLKGDVNIDGAVNATDLQLTINAALGQDIGGLNADVNEDAMTDAVDVQLVIIKLLGL